MSYKVFKYLYKKMSDDLKDADMLIDYACKLKEKEETLPIAKYFAEEAQYRLTKSFPEAHQKFVDLVNHYKEQSYGKKKEDEEEMIEMCLWKERHEEMQDWHDSIKRKIEKF